MKWKLLVLSLILPTVACAQDRYIKSEDSKGVISFTPVQKEDVTGDGVVNMTDAIAVKDKIPVTSNPAPEPPPIVIPTECTIRLSTALWRSQLDLAKPGDVVCFDPGDYEVAAKGQNFESCLPLVKSGEPDKPIVYRSTDPAKPAVFIGQATNPNMGSLTYAICVGSMTYKGPHDPSAVGVHDIVLDNLRAAFASWDGIEIVNSYRIVIRNCFAYGNNYNSPNGYKAGINLDNSHDVLIENCRVFDNGFGICGYEHQEDGHEWPNPDGPYNITIRNSFIYANSRSGNMGNSPGMDIRFATNCTYEGNIFYDNPDAGINGEGNNFCKVLRNICINNWQPGGNNEGGKINVRGGGANVIASNLFVYNPNCGWDATSGAGDLFINNTCYGNGSWGMLAEGWETMMYNNLISGNSTRVPNAYPEQAASGWSLISDWNVYGKSPIVSTTGDTLYVYPPHTKVQPVVLPGFLMPRNDPRQVRHPEEAFGSGDIEEVRKMLAAKYRATSILPGLSLAEITAKANANIPAVKKACDAAIAKAASSPDFQMKQATHRWNRVKESLTGYDTSKVRDLLGKPLTTQPVVGAIQ